MFLYDGFAHLIRVKGQALAIHIDIIDAYIKSIIYLVTRCLHAFQTVITQQWSQIYDAKDH